MFSWFRGGRPNKGTTNSLCTPNRTESGPMKEEALRLAAEIEKLEPSGITAIFNNAGSVLYRTIFAIANTFYSVLEAPLPEAPLQPAPNSLDPPTPPTLAHFQTFAVIRHPIPGLLRSVFSMDYGSLSPLVCQQASCLKTFLRFSKVPFHPVVHLS